MYIVFVCFFRHNANYVNMGVLTWSRGFYMHGKPKNSCDSCFYCDICCTVVVWPEPITSQGCLYFYSKDDLSLTTCHSFLLPRVSPGQATGLDLQSLTAMMHLILLRGDTSQVWTRNLEIMPALQVSLLGSREDR